MPFKGVLVVSKVFATCNEINRLSTPLQSRFRKLFLPRYTEEKFLDVSEKVLTKLQLQLFKALAIYNKGLRLDPYIYGMLDTRPTGPVLQAGKYIAKDDYTNV
ncbi:MAG: hypothetical protein WAJ93_27300 [Candidatus Nitrosopolaris sp.]